VRRARAFAGLAALGLLVAASGCATAQPSGHQGLLEGARPAYRHSIRDLTVMRRGAHGGRAMFTGGRQPGGPARPAVEIAASSLHWPLEHVQVTSPFGKRGREFHEGIDLKARQGTPVLAAQEGTVIYAGSRIRGYGNLVVIRHQRQLSTIYAHNSRILVRVGQFVHQGQKIAISGQSGHVTGPHLHFEVRDGLAALNPMDYLPRLRPVAQAGRRSRPMSGGRSVVAAAANPRRTVPLEQQEE
jgi:murein DD-endopeptidase MepM/ murein hydrolase activator NlpD